MTALTTVVVTSYFTSIFIVLCFWDFMGILFVPKLEFMDSFGGSRWLSAVGVVLFFDFFDPLIGVAAVALLGGVVEVERGGEGLPLEMGEAHFIYKIIQLINLVYLLLCYVIHKKYGIIHFIQNGHNVFSAKSSLILAIVGIIMIKRSDRSS